jgi:hypothetical protein
MMISQSESPPAGRCEGIRINADRSHYDISKNAILRAGLVIAEEGEEPTFVWVDGILSKEDALEHLPFQRSNKIPGMDFICYKSTLFRSLNEMRKQYPQFFDVYPKTYLLPHEFLDFQREHKAICGRMIAPSWVVKPRNACCGKGIIIVQSVAEMQSIEYQCVAQLYVNPFLIRGYKFDFRFWLLIASLEPLSFFIYTEGIARFCTETYEPPSKANRSKKFVHLTNTAINVENSDEPPSAFTRLASEVLEEMISLDPRAETLWGRICEVCRAVIIAIYPAVLHNLPKKCDQRLPASGKRVPSFETKSRDLRPLVEVFDPALSVPRRRPHPEMVRRQMNLVIVPSQPANQPKPIPPLLEMDPVIIGSIVNYQIRPVGSLGVVPRRYSYQPSERSVATAKPPTLVLPPIRGDEEEEEVESNPSRPPPLRLAKRYFHILGIDILIDADMNPKVLELNDRPSLGVTVEFEQELKERVIAEAFEHVCPNGGVRGDSPQTSRWRQIYPEKDGGTHWREVVRRALDPRLPPIEVVKSKEGQSTRSRLEFQQVRKARKRRKTRKGVVVDDQSPTNSAECE